MKLEQALGDGKIASFLNRDPAPRRQKKWIKYDLVINAYDRRDSYNTVFEVLKVVAAMT